MQKASLFVLGFLLCTLAMVAAEQIATQASFPDKSNILSTLSTALQNNGAVGTEFYLTFPQRYKPATTPAFHIFVSSSVRTKVVLEVAGHGALLSKFTVANDVIDFALPPVLAEVYNRKADDIIPADQVYPQASIHIKAGAPIVVYAVSLHEDGGGDSFLAFPISALGKEYFISSMPNMGWMYGNVSYPSEVCVVAPYDNTQVVVQIGGNLVTQTAGGLKTGQSKTFSLSRGDILSISTAYNAKEADLSGTRISANNPIAVVSGHQCANVPSDKKRCAYLAEMEMPTIMWGKQFLLPRYVQRNKSFMVRVMAKEPNTTIFRNGVEWTMLQTAGGEEGKGHFLSRLDETANNGAVLTADKPISVTVFNTSKEDDGVSSMPFQMLMYPIEQYTTQALFHTPNIHNTHSVKNNYCSIIYPLSLNQTIPDDLEFATSENGVFQWKKVSDVFGPSPGDHYTLSVNKTDYAVKQCTLPGDKLYALRCKQPFICYVYGSSDSLGYGHVAGAALKVISADSLPPNPKWQAECDGSVKGGLVTDLPADQNIRSNLSTLVLDPERSYNYTLEYDEFIPGSAVSTKWRLAVENPDKDALAVITFTDRAGNDTTIEVDYHARNITIVRDVDFGVRKISDVHTMKIEVKNEGTSETTVNHLQFKGDRGEGTFEILNLQLPFILKAGEVKEVEIRFQTQKEGDFRDSLGVGDDCVFRYRRLVKAVVGTAIILVTDLDFGQVAVNTPSLPKAFAIWNKGTLPLTITQASPIIPASVGAMFAVDKKVSDISPQNPLVLEPMGTTGDAVVFNVVFTPQERKRYQGELIFGSNAKTFDNICIISGEGVGPTDVQEQAILPSVGIESVTPHPVSDECSIRFRLGHTTPVVMDIVNINGIVVKSLLYQDMGEGQHTLRFRPDSLADGIYTVRLQAEGATITKPFVLSR